MKNDKTVSFMKFGSIKLYYDIFKNDDSLTCSSMKVHRMYDCNTLPMRYVTHSNLFCVRCMHYVIKYFLEQWIYNLKKYLINNRKIFFKENNISLQAWKEQIFLVKRSWEEREVSFEWELCLSSEYECVFDIEVV